MRQLHHQILCHIITLFFILFMGFLIYVSYWKELEESASKLILRTTNGMIKYQQSERLASTSNSITVDQNGNKRGELVCNGKSIESEIIYWYNISADRTYRSPLANYYHQQFVQSISNKKMDGIQYLTVDYDHGGWNNMRMALECAVVLSHASGRTFVTPPLQHIYLLTKTNKDDVTHTSDRDGYDEFYDINLLKTQTGFQTLSMQEFLAKEGIHGRLHGLYPPNNSSSAWGTPVWNYMEQVADQMPKWFKKLVAFPLLGNDNYLQLALTNPHIANRLQQFQQDRSIVYYEPSILLARHIHFPGYKKWRLLQHPYGNNISSTFSTPCVDFPLILIALFFFADSHMQAFYKRFIRDYMRYKDEIQCAGAVLVAAIRKDAMELHSPHTGSDPMATFYAIHIRRGDLEFDPIKIGSPEIVQNLHFDNGTSMIPRGAVVYIATDDPEGVCQGCYKIVEECVESCHPSSIHYNTSLEGSTEKNNDSKCEQKCRKVKKNCSSFSIPRLEGCPNDPSWNAFYEAGWNLKFFHHYHSIVAHMKSNTHGLIETIACARAKLFFGTYGSTFTGYIHRLRGYHGFGEATYYHHKKYLHVLQDKQSFGGGMGGWNREWRTGWTDDTFGNLI